MSYVCPSFKEWMKIQGYFEEVSPIFQGLISLTIVHTFYVNQFILIPNKNFPYQMAAIVVNLSFCPTCYPYLVGNLDYFELCHISAL